MCVLLYINNVRTHEFPVSSEGAYGISDYSKYSYIYIYRDHGERDFFYVKLNRERIKVGSLEPKGSNFAL